MKGWRFWAVYLSVIFAGLGALYIATDESMQIPWMLSEAQMIAIAGGSTTDNAVCKFVDGCEEPDGCHNVNTWSYRSKKLGTGWKCRAKSGYACMLSDAQVRVCYRKYYDQLGCTGNVTDERVYNEAEFCDDYPMNSK